MKKLILLLLTIITSLTSIENQAQVNAGTVGVACPTSIDNPINLVLPVYGNVAINLNTLAEGVVENSDIDDVNFIWLNDDGTEVSNPASAFFSYDGSDLNPCTIDTQVIQLQVQCINDPSFILDAGIFTIYACPNYEDENLFQLPNACNPFIATVCSELMVEYSIDDGLTFSSTSPPPLSLGDPPLEVTYQIFLQDAPFNCIREGVYTVYCEDCPTINLLTVSEEVCVDETLDVSSLIDTESDLIESIILSTPPGNNPAILTGNTFDATGADEGDYNIGFFYPSPGCPDIIVQTLKVGGFCLLDFSAINGDFGEIPMDENSFITLILDLINEGEISLSLYNLSLNSEVFSVNVDDIEIEGQSQQPLTIFIDASNTGTFTDTLYLSSNGEEIAIPLSITITEPTGLTTISGTRIKAYPNPNQGQFVLQAENDAPFSYKIYNSFGQLIIDQKTGITQKTIHLAEAGLYLILVETNDGSWVEKILVK